MSLCMSDWYGDNYKPTKEGKYMLTEKQISRLQAVCDEMGDAALIAALAEKLHPSQLDDLLDTIEKDLGMEGGE